MTGDSLDYWESYTDSEDEKAEDPKVTELSDRLKAQKLSEDSDRQFTDDLFSGCAKAADVEEDPSDNLFGGTTVKQIVLADPFSQIELKCLKDCETAAKKLSQKIETSPAKSPVWLQFLDILLQACEKKLDLKDVQTLKRKIENIIKAREVVQREKTYAKKKPNDLSGALNYKDELDMLYGDLSEDDDEFYYQ
ncbi:conserved hypothetical protein [Theileria equi strain WA]|uniref:Eukaryotic translation initiation factor 3 30 kDa subunit n=1 Tax=Theileria equi strain WA TaxID=1537102 RepID=L1LAS4_THEEQ|nr:conserved hypothetical protein [Theileria equi strain WA]EKX72426.1 conserved hypothetical protein [Theileria equi strain WA]|eukprot:XP_004831878.1 conserved hypothetical protein [Theileria equi strain WA]